MWPHKCSTGWDNYLPLLVGDAVPDAPCHSHVQLAINPKPQISFCGAAFQPFVPFFIHISKITLSQVKNAVLSVKFHRAGNYPTF